MAKEKRTFWEKLKNKYRLSISNETTYEVLFTTRLSRMHFITVVSIGSIILIALTSILIAYTKLREFIPGYPSGEMRSMLITNAIRMDSLNNEILKRDAYLKSIQLVLSGEDSITVAERRERQKISTNNIKFDISSEESNFRAEVEERELFNLSFNTVRKNGEDGGYFHFFRPVEGFVSRNFDKIGRHYGTDVVSTPSAQVVATLDGVVIFTDWAINTGYVIMIQHSNDFISIYKHNSAILKSQGDYVRAGEVIAIVGNTGEITTGPHLHFELWRAGSPLDPENFVSFK